MKMMKGSLEPSPSSYPLSGDEESRIRMKTQSLLQDYEDLLKDTDAKRQRLQMAKKNRSHLTAQVRFLRRKYEDFVKTQPEKFNLLGNQTMATAITRPFMLNHQSQSKTEASARLTPKSDIGTELHRRRKNCTAKPTALPKSAAMDLNQAIKDLEEKESQLALQQQAMNNAFKWYQSQICPATNGVKPAAARKEANKAGKRKISWQEPVAVWVQS